MIPIMSSAAVHFPPDPSPEPLFRLTVQQYHAMIDTGVLTDDDPVELLEGILVFRMPKKPAHRIALAKLERALAPLLPPTTSLQLQEPITLADGEPEPDATVFAGKPEDYTDRHPGPDEVQLVIAIADTTLVRDRGIKLRLRHHVVQLAAQIVDLVGGVVEVYTDVQTSPPDYRKREVYDRQAAVPLELRGQALGSILVAAILP